MNSESLQEYQKLCNICCQGQNINVFIQRNIYLITKQIFFICRRKQLLNKLSSTLSMIGTTFQKSIMF